MKSQYEQLFDHLREEDALKKWIRTCILCGHREVFEEHPSEFCSLCGESHMRITREVFKED